MNKKQLLINISANAIAFIVNFGISFFLTPYLVENIGSEVYGFIPLANNFVNYVSIFTAALNSMAGRFISIKINSNNVEEANIYFNSVLMANTIIAVFLTIPSILMVLNINRVLNVSAHILIDVQLTFAFVFLNMIIALIGNVFSVTTFCKNRLDLSSIRNIQGNIIRVFFILILFSLFKPSIYYVTLTTIIVTIFTILTNIYYTRELLTDIKLNPKNFDLTAIKTLISSGIWNSINRLSAVLSTGLDLLLANLFIDGQAMGVLSIAKTLPSIIVSLVGTISNVFMPQLTIYYAQNDIKSIIKELKFAIKILSVITSVPFAGLLVFGDIFYSLWVPSQDNNLIHILSIVTIIAFMMTGNVDCLYYVFSITDKLKVSSIVLFINAIINAIVVFLALKTTSWGIFAIAGVSSITGIVRNLTFLPIYSAKCLGEKWNIFYKDIAKGLLSIIVISIVYFIIKMIVPINSWFTLFIVVFTCSILGLMINILIMLNKNDRYKAFNLVNGKFFKKINNKK